MSVRLYLLGRWYETRSRRALRKYHQFKKRAEEIFRSIGGDQ